MANIRRRGKTYQFTVSMGFDKNGNRRIKTKTWAPPTSLTEKQAEKEASIQAELFERECRNGNILDENIKLWKFIEYWKQEHYPKIRIKTRSRYDQITVRIIAALGNIRLSKLTKAHILAFYNNLTEESVRENLKYRANADINFILKNKAFSYVKISEKAGLSVNTVSAAIRGGNVSSLTAKKIAKSLKVKTEDLFEPVNKKPLSARTCIHYHRVLSTILNFAVDRDVIFTNPCERIKSLPWKVEQKEARYLDENEVLQLIEKVEKQENYQFEIAVKLLLNTGLRRGELCGLMWDDINFEIPMLTVERAILTTNEQGAYIDGTKNTTSKRTITLSETVANMLNDYKRWQEEHAWNMGDKWNWSGYLFTTAEGSKIHPNTLTTIFHNFIKNNNLPDCCLHSLRHSSASLQISAGIPITTVSKRLGHSTTATTTRIYAHSMRSADERAASVLEDLLNPYKTKKK